MAFRVQLYHILFYECNSEGGYIPEIFTLELGAIRTDFSAAI
jgi:hypothetical protein